MKYLDIKRIRREHHISQKELAERVGCTQSQLSLVENMKRYAPDELVKKIAEELSIANIDKYTTETPRKVIVHEKGGKLPPLDGILSSDDLTNNATVTSLINIIARCHEIIQTQEKEIARLNKLVGEKYQDLAKQVYDLKEKS